jgi:hypothetical protein
MRHVVNVNAFSFNTNVATGNVTIENSTVFVYSHLSIVSNDVSTAISDSQNCTLSTYRKVLYWTHTPHDASQGPCVRFHAPQLYFSTLLALIPLKM